MSKISWRKKFSICLSLWAHFWCTDTYLIGDHNYFLFGPVIPANQFNNKNSECLFSPIYIDITTSLFIQNFLIHNFLFFSILSQCDAAGVTVKTTRSFQLLQNELQLVCLKASARRIPLTSVHCGACTGYQGVSGCSSKGCLWSVKLYTF